MKTEIDRLKEVVSERMRATGIGATPLESLIIRENDEAAAKEWNILGEKLSVILERVALANYLNQKSMK